MMEGNAMDENGIPLPPEPAQEQEETTQAPSAPAENEPVAADEAVTEPEDAEQNKGAGNRIKELNQRAKAAEAKAKSLADKLAEITTPTNIPQQTSYTPKLEPGSEITPEQYQADISKAADAKIELRIAQERAINRINSESVEVVHAYPQLDPQSAQFDQELSDTVTEAVEAQVRVNPYSASVKGTVAKLMKHYQGAVAKEVGKATEEIAKQAADSALRPNGVRQPEKAAAEKTIAELETELGVVIA